MGEMVMVTKRSPSDIWIWIVVTFFLVLVSEASPPDGKGKAPQCAKVTCTTPPEGIKCNKTEIKNPGLIKKIGKLKDCCPAWRCQEEDGSFSTYFGMSGTEAVPVSGKKDKKDKKTGKKSPTTTEKPEAEDTPKPKKSKKKPKAAAPTTTTEKPEEEEKETPKPKKAKSKKKKVQVTTESPEEAETKPTEDKCAEAKAMCPMPEEGSDSCTVTMSKDAMQFKPKGELDSCCPIYNCTHSDGTYRLHYLMTGGVKPKKASAIAKDKGESTEKKKCPNVQCAQEPLAGADGPVCEMSSETESSRIKDLGPFRECCDVWKCTYPDTSFYTHFELQANSFWMAETTFQSEPSSTVVNVGVDDPTTETPTTEKPVVSGDEVVEVEPASIENDDGALVKKKKKPKRPRKLKDPAIPPPAPVPPVGQSSFNIQSQSQQGSSFSSFSNFYSNSSSWSTGGAGVAVDSNQPKPEPQQEDQEPSDPPEGQNLLPPSDNPPQQEQQPPAPQPMSMQQQMQIPMGPPPGTVPMMGAPMMMQQQMMMPQMPQMFF